MLWLSPEQMKRGKKLVRVAANRAVLRFVNGLSLVMDGSLGPTDATPHEVVLRRGKLQLRHYRPLAGEALEIGTEVMRTERTRRQVPVVLVPPLMVQPYIYDLRPEHSMVKTLLRGGFEVFVVDFGIPDRADAHVRLDDYVLDWLPAALARAREVVGRPRLHLGGYCMGAIFALMHTAAHRDEDVQTILSIGAPIDFHKMGMLSFLARTAHDKVDVLVRRVGNIPGQVSSLGMKMLRPVKSVTRYADLFVNLWDDEYVKGFSAMNQWSNDFIPYPSEAFQQFVREFMVENKLKHGGVKFGDRTVDLKTVRAPILAFAGSSDAIAPVEAARAILDSVGSDDKDFRLVSGGHVGVMAGSRAPEEVWRPAVEWLARHDQ